MIAMPTSTLILLIVVFLVTSLIGVVTGSNSLIAVPAMFEVGIEEKRAVATNMFALVFMAVGGAIPFLRNGTVKVGELSPMILLTVVGSAIGAAIVGLITNGSIKVIVTVAMIVIVLFTLLRPKRTEQSASLTARPHSAFGYVLVFLLAIYGGLYSGGYVTVLTAVLVAFFSFSFAGSIAATKVINVFSSLIATIVFLYQGLVDLKLGLILGATMFVGGYIGAHFASKMNEQALRLIFYTAVFILAVKMIFDLVAGR